MALEPFARDTFMIAVPLEGDWTGWTFKGQVRAELNDDSTLIASFTPDTSGLATTGIVTFTIDAAITTPYAAASITPENI